MLPKYLTSWWIKFNRFKWIPKYGRGTGRRSGGQIPVISDSSKNRNIIVILSSIYWSWRWWDNIIRHPKMRDHNCWRNVIVITDISQNLQWKCKFYLSPPWSRQVKIYFSFFWWFEMSSTVVTQMTRDTRTIRRWPTFKLEIIIYRKNAVRLGTATY